MDAIIKETCKQQFGTAYETYRQSVKQNSSTIPQHVKGYYDTNNMTFK